MISTLVMGVTDQKKSTKIVTDTKYNTDRKQITIYLSTQ